MSPSILPLATLAFGSFLTLAAPAPDGPERTWDGRRRVIHEWGTFTTVQGSDGVALGGLLHDPFDLPPFVYDIVDEMALTGLTPKMETPVVYFYAPEEWRLRLRVDFPRGLVTQWYPAPSRANLWERGVLATPRYGGAVTHGFVPPPVPDAESGERVLADGFIDWGRFGEMVVEAPDAPALLPAVTEEDPWRFSRQVRANPITVHNSSGVVALGEKPSTERERFLFYRGLGNFELPVIARVASETVEDGRAVVSLGLHNANPAEPLTGLFLIHVGAGQAGFVELPDLAQRFTADLAIPLAPLATRSAELVERLAATLAETGLYTDEAYAMARTWQASWFEDEGLRLLYVLPPALVERELPLAVTPHARTYVDGKPVPDAAPDEIVRTFVGRLDLLSPAREAALLETARAMESGDAEERERARATVSAWGRYAAPYLVRAAALGAGVAEATR